MTMHTKPRWMCPFCGSKGLRALWRYIVTGTNKLHPCWRRFEGGGEGSGMDKGADQINQPIAIMTEGNVTEIVEKIESVDDEICAYCTKGLPENPPDGSWPFDGFCDAACAAHYDLRLISKRPDPNIHESVYKELERAVVELVDNQALAETVKAQADEIRELREALDRAVRFDEGTVVVAGASRPVFIEARDQRDGSRKWAVIADSFVLRKDGEWEYEPMPSGRKDEFIEATRYDSYDEAQAVLDKWKEGK